MLRKSTLQTSSYHNHRTVESASSFCKLLFCSFKFWHDINFVDIEGQTTWKLDKRQDQDYLAWNEGIYLRESIVARNLNRCNRGKIKREVIFVLEEGWSCMQNWTDWQNLLTLVGYQINQSLWHLSLVYNHHSSTTGFYGGFKKAQVVDKTLVFIRIWVNKMTARLWTRVDLGFVFEKWNLWSCKSRLSLMKWDLWNAISVPGFLMSLREQDTKLLHSVTVTTTTISRQNFWETWRV